MTPFLSILQALAIACHDRAGFLLLVLGLFTAYGLIEQYILP